MVKENILKKYARPRLSKYKKKILILDETYNGIVMIVALVGLSNNNNNPA